MRLRSMLISVVLDKQVPKMHRNAVGKLKINNVCKEKFPKKKPTYFPISLRASLTGTRLTHRL